jgi:hypothetical protein
MNSNVKQMRPNRIREAVVMENKTMVLVVILEVVVVVIIMDRMVANATNPMHRVYWSPNVHDSGYNLHVR